MAQNDDAAVIVAEAQLARRVDHDVGLVPVGLSFLDAEATGQLRRRPCIGDQVVDGEVRRATDDVPLVLSVSDGDVADRLLEARQLFDVEDAGHYDVADVVAGDLDMFDL